MDTPRNAGGEDNRTPVHVVDREPRDIGTVSSTSLQLFSLRARISLTSIFLGIFPSRKSDFDILQRTAVQCHASCVLGTRSTYG
jgi:hypothetical protein